MPARVTVVGGGVTALLTAVECVLDGHRVTVVDQGSGAHGRAGSGSCGPCIRRTRRPRGRRCVRTTAGPHWKSCS